MSTVTALRSRIRAPWASDEGAWGWIVKEEDDAEGRRARGGHPWSPKVKEWNAKRGGGQGWGQRVRANIDGDGDEEIVGIGMAMGRIGGMGARERTGVYTRRRRLLAGATLSLLWHRSTTHHDFLPPFQRDL